MARTQSTEVLHDGRSITFFDAIQRRRGEAQQVISNFDGLNSSQQSQPIPSLLISSCF